MVPVYFVDRPATDSRDGEQVRIAVNGQTGRAAAVVFSDKRETHVVAPLNPSLHLSGESTVHATPIEVKYVKSPFLYQMRAPWRRRAAASGGSGRRGFLPRRKAQTQGIVRCDFLVSRGVVPGRRAASQGHETNLRLLGTCYHCR